MKKILFLVLSFLFTPLSLAADVEQCPNAQVLTECPNGKHLAEILTSAHCLQTQCLTLDEIALAAESTLSLPEELSEDDLGKVDAQFDTANNLLNIFNQEVSNRRTELAELKQTVAQMEEDPEAYAAELKSLLDDLREEEAQKRQYEIEIQNIDSEINTAVSELEALLQSESPAIKNAYQNILNKYGRGNSVSFKTNFDFKKLQAQLLPVETSENNTFLETFNSPESPNLETNPFLEAKINTLQNQMNSIDSDINAAQTVIYNEQVNVRAIENEITLFNQAQEFETLQTSGSIQGVSSDLTAVNNAITALENKETLTSTESQQLKDLQRYRELSAQKSEFEDRGFLGLEERGELENTRNGLEQSKQEALTAFNATREEQQRIIDEKTEAKESAQSELLGAKAEEAQWKAETTTGEESRQHYDTQANLLEERAQAASGEEKVALQTQALEARLAGLDKIESSETVEKQKEWLEAQKTLLTTDAEFESNREAIQEKSEEIRRLEAEKQKIEKDLTTADEAVNKKKQELEDARGRGASAAEIAQLEAELATAEGSQRLLSEDLAKKQEEIKDAEEKLADLEETQKDLNKKRQESRSTLSKADCVYQDATGNNIYSNEYCVQLESAIGETKSIHGKTGLDLLRNYIGVMYKYFASIIGILAVLVIVVSGIQMSMAGFNSEFSSQAKTRIFQALASLILLFLISLILRTVNPIFFTKAEPNIGNEITAKV